jgi:hypothetical protein
MIFRWRCYYTSINSCTRMTKISVIDKSQTNDLLHCFAQPLNWTFSNNPERLPLCEQFWSIELFGNTYRLTRSITRVSDSYSFWRWPSFRSIDDIYLGRWGKKLPYVSEIRNSAHRMCRDERLETARIRVLLKSSIDRPRSFDHHSGCEQPKFPIHRQHPLVSEMPAPSRFSKEIRIA